MEFRRKKWDAKIAQNGTAGGHTGELLQKMPIQATLHFLAIDKLRINNHSVQDLFPGGFVKNVVRPLKTPHLYFGRPSRFLEFPSSFLISSNACPTFDYLSESANHDIGAIIINSALES